MSISVCFFFDLTLVTNPRTVILLSYLNSYKDNTLRPPRRKSLSYFYSLYLFLLEAISRVVCPFPVLSSLSAFLLLVLFSSFCLHPKRGCERGRKWIDGSTQNKINNKKWKKRKKKTDIAAVVIDAVAVLFDTILARGSIGVDGNQKAKKKKKIHCLWRCFPSINFNSLFFPPLFVYFISYCCCWRVPKIQCPFFRCRLST